MKNSDPLNESYGGYIDQFEMKQNHIKKDHDEIDLSEYQSFSI